MGPRRSGGRATSTAATRDSRVGHALYNYGSLDGGIVSGVWNAHQAFFVTGGMRYAHAIPEIYNRAMAREWAALAQVAQHRYHRPSGSPAS